jgi:hypothetical protein
VLERDVVRALEPLVARVQHVLGQPLEGLVNVLGGEGEAREANTSVCEAGKWDGGSRNGRCRTAWTGCQRWEQTTQQSKEGTAAASGEARSVRLTVCTGTRVAGVKCTAATETAGCLMPKLLVHRPRLLADAGQCLPLLLRVEVTTTALHQLTSIALSRTA